MYILSFSLMFWSIAALITIPATLIREKIYKKENIRLRYWFSALIWTPQVVLFIICGLFWFLLQY